MPGHAAANNEVIPPVRPSQLVKLREGQASHLEENKEYANGDDKWNPVDVEVEAHNKDAHEAPEDQSGNPVLDRVAETRGILEASRVPLVGTHPV